MNLHYFKNNCDQCAGGVEFPAHGIGERIACPHCGAQVNLTFPLPTELDATQAIARYLECSGFPSKVSELCLLSQFSGFPRDPATLNGKENWRVALGSDPSVVLSLLFQHGLLQDGSEDVVALLQTKSSDELRSLATSRGLGKSGNKQTLSKRLFKKDEQGMRTLFRGRKYLICTKKGQIISDKVLEAEREKKSHAEHATWLSLLDGRLNEACLTVAAFEATRIFPRGIGRDWSKYDSEYDLRILHDVFNARLKRHSKFDNKTMHGLAVAAAMIHLWGSSNPSPWLPEHTSDEGPDFVTEVMMILSYAQHRANLADIKASGLRQVRILSSGRPDICRVCRAQDGKVYSVDATPELPHEGCSCEHGCACTIVANH